MSNISYKDLVVGAATISVATGKGTFGDLELTGGNIKILAGSDIRPSSNSTTAINIAQADGTDFVIFDTTNKRVGIGVTPSSALDLYSAAANIELRIQGSGFSSDLVPMAYGTSARPGISGYRSRGTSSSPSAVSANDILLSFGGRGYGTTRFASGSNSAVVCYAAEAFTDSAQGSYLAFETTLIGSTSRVSKMKLLDTGNLLLYRTDTANPVLAIIQNLSGNGYTSGIFLSNSTSEGGINTGSQIHSLRTNLVNGSSDLIFSVTNGTTLTERMRILSTGNIGIGTTAPLRRLDINEASGNCLRLIYNDSDGSAANYTDFLVSSSGDLTITPSGGDIIVGSGSVRASASSYRRYYHMPLGSANPGASGATWVNASANTTGGWRLTNATWLIRGQAYIHADWDGATDLTVGVNFMVNVDNTGGGVGDTVDIKATVYYKGVGDTATKSQVVEVATIVGQSAQYKQFRAEFTINWDETSNVVEVGDVIAVVINLETDTSEVDDIVVTSMEFSYQTTHIGVESGDI